jgi:hypothetical protein
MKTTTLFRLAAGRNMLLALLLTLWVLPGRAQFSTTPAQSAYVCNTTGNQVGVQAVADGAGGSFVVWIDRRGGNNTGSGTALYAQRYNAEGVPQLAANGTRLVQTRGREIWNMRAIAWNGGVLVAWVQGAFGIGGDSIRCQLYSPAGVAQWATPTVVASTVPNRIIFVSTNDLNIIPTASGAATLTFDAALTGNFSQFAYNQVSPTGALRWALNSTNQTISQAVYYHTVGDGGDGFYLVGALGQASAIVAQHFTASGSASWATYTTVVGAGSTGRATDWLPLIDPAGNLYVAWDSNGGDVFVSKVLPSGTLAWPGTGYVNVCTYNSTQDYAHAIWYNNALWLGWEDSRGSTGTLTRTCYAQQVNASGQLAWSPDGVPVYTTPASYLQPKLAASDNGSVMVFFNDNIAQRFSAQKLLPTGLLAFPAAGVALNQVVNDRPYYLDYVPVSQPNGSVQVYWSSPGQGPSGVNPTGRDIVYGRMQTTGTLLNTEAAAARLGFAAYPNPAHRELYIQLPAGATATGLCLYDALGRPVRAFAAPGPNGPLLVQGLAAGVYVLRGELAGHPVSCRVAVAE